MKSGKKANASSRGFNLAIAFIIFSVVAITIIAIRRATESEKADRFEINPVKMTSTNKNDVKKEDSELKEEEIDDEEELDENEAKAETKELKFMVPVNSAEIVREFSGDELVHFKTINSYRTHNGIDLKARKQAAVKAVADGVVSNIKNEEGTWGVCVEIDHGDGLKSFYCGLSGAVQVKIDQKIKIGEVLGYVSDENLIEKEQGPHLHFAMKEKNKFVDPGKYIKQYKKSTKAKEEKKVEKKEEERKIED